MSVLEKIHGLLTLAVDNGASAIHIKSNKPAFLRLSGHLDSVEMNLKGIFLSTGGIVG